MKHILSNCIGLAQMLQTVGGNARNVFQNVTAIELEKKVPTKVHRVRSRGIHYIGQILYYWPSELSN